MEKLQVFKNKKVMGVILSVVLLMVAAIGVTMALYNAESNKVVNQFSVGNITTELVEDFYQKGDSDTKTEFVKAPKVVNSGADPCLVRIRVNITPENVAGKTVKIGKEQKPYLEITDRNGKAWVYNDSWSNDKWEYKDGWYYYKGVLNPGESTEPLFSNVVVNYDQDEEWEDFDIILYHEAIQSEVFEYGIVYSATDENGKFDSGKAELVWKTYLEDMK